MTSINNVDIQDLPIKLKNNVNLQKMFHLSTCNVSVHWIILSKKKNIVKFGSSRAISKGHQKSSFHAEEMAIKYCIKQKQILSIILLFGDGVKMGILLKNAVNLCCLPKNLILQIEFSHLKMEKLYL